jgi:lipopolysaccharide biosynthesis regulator YciM
MKVKEKDKRQNEGQLELFERAQEFEKKGRLDEAATLYQNIIKKSPTKEHAYNRLMIIHRKKKEYKKEKETLDAGIKAFEQYYKAVTRIPAKKSIETLSKSLLKATGLADRTGKLTYEREPLGRWKKRRKIVESKLKH